MRKVSKSNSSAKPLAESKAVRNAQRDLLIESLVAVVNDPGTSVEARAKASRVLLELTTGPTKPKALTLKDGYVFEKGRLFSVSSDGTRTPCHWPTREQLLGLGVPADEIPPHIPTQAEINRRREERLRREREEAEAQEAWRRDQAAKAERERAAREECDRLREQRRFEEEIAQHERDIKRLQENELAKGGGYF